jgi:peptide/nickel transport system permease protein
MSSPENRVTGFAFGLFLLIVLAAVFGPYIVPHDPLASDTAAALKPPSMKHWFGTGPDRPRCVQPCGRGRRGSTFFIAVASVALVFLMGGLAGVAAGFFGGWTDRIVGRIADTIMAFPLFVLAMGIVAALGNTVQNIILATCDRELSALRPGCPRRGQCPARGRLRAGGAAIRQR